MSSGCPSDELLWPLCIPQWFADFTAYLVVGTLLFAFVL